jgi:hypothetical protein
MLCGDNLFLPPPHLKRFLLRVLLIGELKRKELSLGLNNKFVN